MTTAARIKLMLILWAVGIVGVLSLLLIDLPAMIAMFPTPAGQAPPELPSPALLKVLTVIQPAFLVTTAVAVGAWVAPKVGLRAPAAEAAALGEPVVPALKPQLLPGVLAGIVCGVLIVLTWVIARPFLTADFIEKAQPFNELIPAPIRFLYGGITEEVLLRWGLMTVLVWLLWRVFQRRGGLPHRIIVGAAIIISAVAFGVGHLPIASMLAGGLNFPLVAYVVTANSIFGLAAGYLYWKRGLESAIIAHMTAHVVMLSAILISL